MMITQERLKEIFIYSPDTGLFTWRITMGRMRGVLQDLSIKMAILSS